MFSDLIKKLWFPVLVVVVIVVLAFFVNHYRDNAITYKGQRDAARNELSLANSTITDMQTRQRDVAALDAKYTGELEDAKATINQLERDVVAGKRRLQLNATCQAVHETTSTSELGNATGPRLNDTAERDYFTLRERIETVTRQVGYLQDYINTQCLK